MSPDRLVFCLFCFTFSAPSCCAYCMADTCVCMFVFEQHQPQPKRHRSTYDTYTYTYSSLCMIHTYSIQ